MKIRLLYLTLIATLLFAACKKEPQEPNGNGDTPAERLYREGITRISADSLAFVLFAPGKTEIYLIGDFNDWTISPEYKMKKEGNVFRLNIGGLDNTKEYICQYLIDNRIRIADPYVNKISDPYHDQFITADIYPNMLAYPTGKTTEIAMVVTTAVDNYQWQVQNFKAPAIPDLVIYELLIRDFTEQGTVKAVQEKLPYLKSLGVNAIELMPFNEFEGNDSWGYNSSFYFATDKAYGTSRDYKEFIDACHQNGIAVIMDMVLNHSYGQSPLVRMYQNSSGAPSASNPWYNAVSPNQAWSWGYDFNHESIHTKHFVDSVCAYWMKEYKIDGFRLDFTKGFTQIPGDGWNYDLSRINILKRIADEIWKRKSDALIILEHFTDNREEKELAEYGMLLWGNMNYNMNEATMGWLEDEKSDLTWSSHMERGWSVSHLIAYMESHDEERLMYKNIEHGNSSGTYNVKNLATGLQRTAAAAVIYFAIPEPKMIWQFGELGYDISIDYNGRTGRKPVRWNYYDVPERKALHDVFATMANLKKEKSSLFNPPSYTQHTYDLREAVKYVSLFSSSEDMVAVANFDVVTQTKSVEFRKTGTWRCLFTNEQLTTTSEWQDVTLPAGEYRLYFNE
ncbi:MAG: alpha-amylase [Prevotellaceae bacterium]|jgi:glycosidase|nr:alpha-amylase [Prevotellaceae bacterium]